MCLIFVCSVDATNESLVGCTLGRLVNHSKKGLTKTRVVVGDGLPHLYLFALSDVSAGRHVV